MASLLVCELLGVELPQTFRSPKETCLRKHTFFVGTMRRILGEAAERGSRSLRTPRSTRQRHQIVWGRRWIQISTTPSGTPPAFDNSLPDIAASTDSESPGNSNQPTLVAPANLEQTRNLRSSARLILSSRPPCLHPKIYIPDAERWWALVGSPKMYQASGDNRGSFQ